MRVTASILQFKAPASGAEKLRHPASETSGDLESERSVRRHAIAQRNPGRRFPFAAGYFHFLLEEGHWPPKEQLQLASPGPYH